MQIAFVSQYFHPEPFSNAEIAQAMRQRGHDVEVLTAVPNYPAGEFYEGYSNKQKRRENWKGIDIRRVFTLPRKSGALRLIVNYLTFATTASWAARFGRWEKPDVVFVSQLSPVLMGLPAIILARRYKVPMVLWVQDIWPESATFTLGLKNPLMVKPLRWISGWIYRRADHILVQSAAFPPMITRFGIPDSKIRIFPNTAPDCYFPVAPKDAKDKAQLVPQTGFRIMFAGNIGESQDFDTILDTAKALQTDTDVQWVIIGSGRDLPRVQERVSAEGLTDVFHFLGRHPQEEMSAFFAHADAMLVSLKDTPIFSLTVPYKIQSYMACGKPIIASLDGEGARIVSEAKAGVVSPACNPKALEAAIRDMLGKTEIERKQLGRNSLQYFQQHYASDMLYNRLAQWLQEAADSCEPLK